ncbi:hypothetical protein [Burkholderia multivorans]|uniref:hypothetical protein n=1 Tax=Burkholderia multivorans TaxID=87883 RepID=UPI00111E98BC|nr:hypothetical protein [Burkholderia multivorans]MCO1342634.1 hypothetical protein [Burkholderia multivorans]MCO1443329.1 hypothetical protein [Burkholderia multivorans]UQO27100.1 hypothetical protein L0Z21_08820 [Burkholderia multivorans]UQO40422.1 hypothetical protein L0Z43_09320 [Burkholderia multivorans]HEF5153860.1 hypothetical protein [Burkholderia multivorans]
MDAPDSKVTCRNGADVRRDELQPIIQNGRVGCRLLGISGRHGVMPSDQWSIADLVRRAVREFALRDMRPAAVTDRQEEGDDRIIDATGHADERMVRKTYDRRRQRKVRATR